MLRTPATGIRCDRPPAGRPTIGWRLPYPLRNGPSVPKIYFDERIAAGYDANSTDMFEPLVLDPAVDFLADLAGSDSALELGIGTGRVALPLSRRGVRVHGIELPPTMVGQLRTKPGADDIGVTIGDFATTRPGSSFRLAYLVYNTITNLTSQDEQVKCFHHCLAEADRSRTSAFARPQRSSEHLVSINRQPPRQRPRRSDAKPMVD